MFLGKSQHYGRVHKPWWFLEQPKKSENYLKQRDFRICGFLRVFAGFCGLFAGFLRGFAGFIPSRLMRCKHFLAFVSPNPKTCNQSPKIQDLGVLGKISRYRSNSENTYIFLGFGGSRYIYIYLIIYTYIHTLWSAPTSTCNVEANSRTGLVTPNIECWWARGTEVMKNVGYHKSEKRMAGESRNHTSPSA